MSMYRSTDDGLVSTSPPSKLTSAQEDFAKYLGVMLAQRWRNKSDGGTADLVPVKKVPSVPNPTIDDSTSSTRQD